MGNTTGQKFVLVLLAAAATAGLFEFYKQFVVGSMESVNGGYKPTASHANVTPRPTPRRF